MDHIKVAKVENVTLLNSSWPIPSTSKHTEQPERTGTLHLTPHHLIFSFDDDSSSSELWLPHPLLLNLTLHPPSHTALTPLVARTRHFAVYTFLFKSHIRASEVFDSIKAIVQNTTTLSSLYALSQPPVSAAQIEKDGLNQLPSDKAWSLYKPEDELARMGAMATSTQDTPRSAAWRWTDVNAEFEFCATYPAKLAVPAKISDVTLKYGKSYRSKARVPALVYLHWANLGSITRSSQPMVGIKGARSIQDEKLIEAIFHSHTQHSTLPSKHSHTNSSSTDPPPPPIVYGAKAANLIIDARPTTNAVANSVKGAGTENMEHYRDCKKAYLGIDNIHVMRDSLRVITDALRDAETTGYVDKQALRRSGWLKHLSAILEGSVLIAKNIHIANSHVLIHCSDGWDRTAQLSAIAQLCLDPFYRTIKGLAILIEKDFVSFGHKFGHRSGHLVLDRTNFDAVHGDSQNAFLATVSKNLAFSSAAFKETSPVFHQFLDCVYQMIRQYPKRFQYDTKLLEKLYYELYSCCYGTFLYNCEAERKTGPQKAADTSRSVWETIFAGNGSPKEEYLNPEYDPSLDDPKNRSPSADQGVLLPNPRDVIFWYQLFRQSDDDMNGLGHDETPPDVVEVTSSADDPVVSILEGTNTGLVENVSQINNKATLPFPSTSQTARSPSPALPSPASPSTQAYSTGPNFAPAQAHLQSAMSSVFKFGGSSWKSIRNTYQEAVKDYQAPSPVGSSSTESKRATRDGEELGTWKAPKPHQPSQSSSRPTSRPPSNPPSVPGSPRRRSLTPQASEELPKVDIGHLPREQQPQVTTQLSRGLSGLNLDVASNPWATSQSSNFKSQIKLSSVEMELPEKSRPNGKASSDPLGVGL